MGIKIFNSISPQQAIWLVGIVEDSKTGAKLIVMGAKIQRNITATIGIDKILKTNGSVGHKLNTVQQFIRAIVK